MKRLSIKIFTKIWHLNITSNVRLARYVHIVGAHSAWDQLFSVHFFVKNMGKIVPQLNKKSVFKTEKILKFLP